MHVRTLIAWDAGDVSCGHRLKVCSAATRRFAVVLFQCRERGTGDPGDDGALDVVLGNGADQAIGARTSSSLYSWMSPP